MGAIVLATAMMGKGSKNIALFAAAPFIGLVYAVAPPFVGLDMLARFAATAIAHATGTPRVLAAVKSVAPLVAASFIGSADAVLLPVVGIAMTVKAGCEAGST